MPFILPTWIFHENIFHNIIKLPFSQKFSNTKISQYTVVYFAMNKNSKKHGTNNGQKYND